VTFVTFVSHYTILEVDRDRVAFIHCVDPFLKLDHRKAVVDRVSKEDAQEPLDDSYPSPAQEIGRCAIEGRFVLLSLSGSEAAAIQGGR
jgi:hypothetical protein